MDDQAKHYADKLAYEIDSWDLKVAIESVANKRAFVRMTLISSAKLHFK